MLKRCKMNSMFLEPICIQFSGGHKGHLEVTVKIQTLHAYVLVSLRYQCSRCRTLVGGTGSRVRQHHRGISGAYLM
jgi:hypothetical protein